MIIPRYWSGRTRSTLTTTSRIPSSRPTLQRRRTTRTTRTTRRSPSAKLLLRLLLQPRRLLQKLSPPLPRHPLPQLSRRLPYLFPHRPAFPLQHDPYPLSYPQQFLPRPLPFLLEGGPNGLLDRESLPLLRLFGRNTLGFLPRLLTNAGFGFDEAAFRVLPHPFLRLRSFGLRLVSKFGGERLGQLGFHLGAELGFRPLANALDSLLHLGLVLGLELLDRRFDSLFLRLFELSIASELDARLVEHAQGGLILLFERVARLGHRLELTLQSFRLFEGG
mmetsp:Transcript_25519/g.55133  ORF Transcript_25519/g.55133 Transcript_25519/m.55133 type:complete len:277 (+) Transcript_25519:293-1123(+)